MPPTLSRSLLTELAKPHYTVDAPSESVLDLPVRIVQFGTGRFLRGFVDYFVDKANRAGVFNGRILAVSSTGSGRDDALGRQDGLYTLVERGLEGGLAMERFKICASIHHALSAQDDWPEVLAAAKSPELCAIVSNTTEVGIKEDPHDTLDGDPPPSFPAKLAAFLYHRASHFGYASDAGLVVLPCELIENNGDALRNLVLHLSDKWNLPDSFRSWVQEHCLFCNTLVDRIVTGLSSEEEQAALSERLGYADDLFTVAEVYRLYAIEGPPDLIQRLPFLGIEDSIIVAEDIRPYRDRKVRILNGTHTIMVPVALLAGLDTVLQAVKHPIVGRFIRHVMLREIVPTLDVPDGQTFAAEVLDRFANPHIQHPLLNITLQATTKMRHRVVPSILACAAKGPDLPHGLLFGFACYLLFMRGTRTDGARVFGERDGRSYPIQDDRAMDLFGCWQGVDTGDPKALATFARRVLGDTSLWDADLTAIPGLAEAVADYLSDIERRGVETVLADVLAART